MEWNIIFLFIFLASFESTVNYSLTEYFKNKTLDEMRYIIVALEKYLMADVKFESMLFSLNTMNRSALTSHTEDFVSQYGRKSLPSIESFYSKIKIYPLSMSYNDIIQEGERYNLVSWASNAEKYFRKMEDLSHLIGGISDYGQYLQRSQLISFINEIIEKYTNLKERDVFDREILNIRYEIPSVIQLLRESSISTLKGYLYQTENYLQHKTGKYNGSHHELLLNDSYTKEDLSRRLYEVINSNNELKSYDVFYKYFINKNASFIHPASILMNKGPKSMIVLALTCEKYRKQYYNLSNSFKNLTNYVWKIPKNKLQKYIQKEIEVFPELSMESINDDFENNKHIVVLGQFSVLLNKKSRSDLIQIYLNLQSQTNETSKYNNNLGKIFRLTDRELRSTIIDIIEEKRGIINYELIERIKYLFQPTISDFIQKYPRIVLQYWYGKLISYLQPGYNVMIYVNQSMSNEELVRSITALSNFRSFRNFREFRFNVDQEKYCPLFGGIIDYLKAVNINVLLTWLSKFEVYHRTKNNLINVQGGLLNHTSLTKLEIINMIMTYIWNNPQFNNATQFDQLTGNRFARYYKLNNNFETLKSIASNLDGYRRRMNPQLEYGKPFHEYIKERYSSYYREMLLNQMLFFIFRIISVYPELNIPEIYDSVMEEVNYANLPTFLFKVGFPKLREYCKLIERYINEVNNDTQSHNFSTYNQISLIKYIYGIYRNNPTVQDKSNLFRIFNNQTDYLFWNIDSYLNRQNRLSLIRILNSIDKYYNPMYHVDNVYLTEKDDSLRELIQGELIAHPELKDYNKFDRIIDSIFFNNEENTIQLYNKLIESKRNKLTLLALTAEYTYIKNNKLQLYSKISNHLYTVTNNELIRYILYGREDESLEELFNYNELTLISHTLNLDVGEDNINDLFKEY